MRAKASLATIFALLLGLGILAGCTRAPRNDAAIATDIQGKINADSSVPTKQIQVQSDKGVVTLSGNVLPVGGIKEKFLAAKRAGVRDVILPTECKQQVDEDLAPDQIEGVTLHYAARIEEVLAVALPMTQLEKVKDDVVREEVIHAGV